MKERLKKAIKVVLTFCMIAIILIYMYKNTAQTSSQDVRQAPIEKPTFYDKSPQDGLWEALLFYDIKHPEIVYAQALLETGYFKSKGCTRDNNLFGLYNSKMKRYHKFNHWAESVVKYKEWIQYKYKPPNDYYEFLRKIHYAEDPMYITKLKQIVKKHGNKYKQNTGSSYYQQAKQGS